MQGRPTIASWGLLLLVAACGGQAAREVPFRVDSTSADGANERGQALFYLNHPIRVDFSQPIDPLSVTGDTVRVLDQAGHPVPGQLRIGTRSVTFEPAPPLAPTLDDGGLRPDQIYRLEVAGFPRTNAVRAADGTVLERTEQRSFRTMGTDVAALGLASPLLPVQRGDEEFELRPDLLGGLRMAAASRRLQLHFTLPVLPSTARPQAFRIHRQVDMEHQLVPSRVQVLSRPAPQDPHPGCTVELLFDEASDLEPNDVLYVLFATGPHALRDYRGRPVELSPGLSGWLRIPVDPGLRRNLAHLRAGTDALRLLPAAPDQPGFVVVGSRILPEVFVECGTGRLGVLAPKRDLRLVPGQPFDRGDGLIVQPDGGRFDFTSIRIPRGVTVRLEPSPDQPICLRSLTAIEIEGDLLLGAGAVSPIVPAAGDQLPAARLIDAAAVALVAAREIAISGRIRLEHPTPPRSALSLVSGGPLRVRGELPARTVLAVPPGTRVDGSAVAPIPVEVALTPGLAPGALVTAEAWTDWYRMPGDRIGPIDVELLDADADAAPTVAVQIAPPDPVDPSRPYLAAGGPSRPAALPLRSELVVARGGFVRLSLRAVLRDETLPSLAGFSIVSR
jgi:hypothetical protein